MKRLALVVLSLVSPLCVGQVLIPAAPRNQPTQVAAAVVRDPATHLYKYSYSLTNQPGNTAPADTFVVKVTPGVDVITNITDPQGWIHIYSEDKSTIHWAAVGFLDEDAPRDPSGNISVSDFAVSPGATLGGFSFESFGPPGIGTVITQTFALLPTAVSEDDFEPFEAGSWLPEDNGHRLQVSVPISDLDWNGNRRPTVDGFLVFGNLKDKDSFTGSVLVVVRFAVGGESVQMNTFKAELNNVNVTTQFVFNEAYKGYVAKFEPSQGVLVAGSNVMLTSVAGSIPGVIDRTVLDNDRVSFKFHP